MTPQKMENFEPVDVDFIINSAEVQKEAAKVKEEITGVAVTAEKVTVTTSKKIKEELEKTSKKVKEETITATRETQKLNTELDKSAVNLGKQGKAATQAKAQWNGLGNSINQISRELPAFTYSAQTGFMAMSNNIPILVDEIARLKVANVAAAASGAATIPIWHAIKAAMFSWMTAISVIITLFTVFGKEISGFIKGLFDTKSAIDDAKVAQEAMSEAFKSNQVSEAVSDMAELRQMVDLAKQGLIDQTTVLELHNESLGKVTKEVNLLNDAEANINANADNYIKATLAKAAADAAREKGVKEQIELMNKQLDAERKLEEAVKKEDTAKKYNFETGRGVGSSAQQAASERMAADRELKEIEKQLDDSINQMNRTVTDFMKKSLKSGINVIGDESQFNKINANIKKVTEAYETAGMEQAEKEVKQIKDKFAKIRTEAQKFNADPANRANVIDLAGLDATEQKAIEAAREKNKNESVGKVSTERQNLLDKIAAIDAEYARKSYTKDEEELQALRDKFGKVRELVERFNADPKNKAKRIDLAGLDATENQAVADLTFRQETDLMAKEITRQKQLFQEFEAYKVQFGSEKAKEQYGEQIGEYESYMDYLRGLVDKNQDTYSAVTLGNASGGQSERFTLLEKEAEAAIEVNGKINQKILAENMTFQDSLVVLEENYQQVRLALIEQGEFDEAEILRVKHEEKIEKLKDGQLQKTEAYKNFFRNVQRMTVANARVLIAAMDKELENHQESAEELAKIEERKARLLRLIRSQTLEDISKITGALGALGQSLIELGASTGSGALSEIGGLMSGLASGVNDLLVAFDDDASKSDKIAAGISGLVKMVDMLAGAARRRREAEEDYYKSVIGFQNDYNLSLNEQIRLQSVLGDSVFLKDFEGRMRDGISAVSDASKKYQEAMDALSGAQVKSGQKNAIDWGNVGKGASSGAAVGAAVGSIVPVIGTAIGAIVGGITGALAGLFGGMKKKDTFLPLLEEYPDLLQKSEDGVTRINRALAENLIQNNLVDEKTKAILENILDWDDALTVAQNQIKDVVSELAGQLGNDMRNALVDAFRAGEDAAKAMGDTVEKVLENILSQLIFNRVFADTFKKLEEEMIDSEGANGDSNWVDDFERFFEASKGLSEQWDQAMKDAQAQAAASGFDIFKPEGAAAKPEGLTGGIMRITEETGQELAGLQRGTYDITKRTFVLNETRYALEQKRYEALIQMLMILGKIESNTGYTVIELQAAVIELKTIAKNTKGGPNGRDLGMDG